MTSLSNFQPSHLIHINSKYFYYTCNLYKYHKFVKKKKNIVFVYLNLNTTKKQNYNQKTIKMSNVFV